MTVRSALQTARGEWFFKSPRTLSGWAAEWLMIAALRSLTRASILFARAGRRAESDRAFRILKAMGAILTEEDTA